MIMATWQLVETWHHGSIFEAQRAKLELFDGFFARLLTCMFCLSHWAATFVVGWCAVSYVLMHLEDYHWIGEVMVVPVLALAVVRGAQVGHDVLRAIARRS